MSKLLSFKEFVDQSEVNETTFKRVSRIRKGKKQLMHKVATKIGFKMTKNGPKRMPPKEKRRHKLAAMFRGKRSGQWKAKTAVARKKVFARFGSFIQRQREKNKKNKK